MQHAGGQNTRALYLCCAQHASLTIDVVEYNKR